jgi:hypothetical protein
LRKRRGGGAEGKGVACRQSEQTGPYCANGPVDRETPGGAQVPPAARAGARERAAGETMHTAGNRGPQSRAAKSRRKSAAIGKADRRIVRSERTPGETRGRKTRGATARKEITFTVIRGDPIAERGRSPSAMPASCQIISSIGNSGETLTTQSQEAKTDAKPEYLGSAEVRPVRPPEI